MIYVYEITPVPAPRQTRADAWRTGLRMRPEVARYRAYCDLLQVLRVQVPAPFHHVVFVLPMPKSWSRAERKVHEGTPHKTRPDRDNLEKALLDGLFGQDAHVWDGRTTKLWGEMGLLIISDAMIKINPIPFDLSPYYTAVLAARAS